MTEYLKFLLNCLKAIKESDITNKNAPIITISHKKLFNLKKGIKEKIDIKLITLL